MYKYLFLILLLIPGCVTTTYDYNRVETVMSEGMIIEATNSLGTIKITAGKGYKRSYFWEGGVRTVNMKPRTDRWYGKLGIYYPGDGDHWENNNGITRAVLEEAELYFDSLDEAMEFLAHTSRRNITVYNDKGLAVSWSKSLKPNSDSGGVLHVDVWQIFIKNKRPVKLPGAFNDRIRIIR